ncbi:MAG: hypothetical protein IJ146_05535 [Kiritimatiellae bacterium]|nr:hypothetical protein [Kiritimatiellia bacterium]
MKHKIGSPHGHIAFTAKYVRAALAAAAFASAAFAARPYDAQVEYLEAPVNSAGKVPYINTGLMPADDMGVLLRVAAMRATADTTVCGALESLSGTDWGWYIGFNGGSGGYLRWNANGNPGTRFNYSANSVYDIYFNYFNDRGRRLHEVDGTYSFSLPIDQEWPSGATKPIYLFAYDNKGTPGNTGNARIYSAQFTKGDAVVMDLVPVRKDGVGYMYDKVTGALLGSVADSALADLAVGGDVASSDESYIEGTVTLYADADWTSRGMLRLDASTTIDLSGHSLLIVGAFGDGVITDSSSGNPGTLRITAPSGMAQPLSVTTSGNIAVIRSRGIYDAQVEYLEAPLSDGKVPYIDTGLLPADDLGVRLRVAPLRESNDTTVCGAMSTVKVNNKNVDWRWYMGFNTRVSGYLSWGTGNPGTRFSYSPNTIYDILFNHLNSRNRRVEEVGGGYSFDLPITDAWPSGATHSIYLFAFNNKGTPGNTGNARIYSAQFTKGGKVVMDLIPVRKGGVGYMYDKVSEKLLAKVATAPADFTYFNDESDVSYIEGNITLDADADWTSRGILRLDAFATIDLNGHSLAIAGAYGEGTITNSSETVGEVHFVVPERMDHTSSIRLLGNLKVVKEGAGMLALVCAGQTFTGGVVVSEGTAYAPNTSVAQKLYSEAKCYWGASNTTILVEDGAKFDTNGNYDFSSKNFVLNGGTLANSGTNMDETTGDGIGNLTLTADSSIYARWHTYFTSSPTASVDLGGHTLTADMVDGSGAVLYLPLAVSNGTIVAASGGYIGVPEGKSGGSPSLNLVMNGATFYLQGEFAVSNYVAAYTKRWNHGAEPLKVYGTFTPAGVDEGGFEYFHGCEMQDGSSIDLSVKTAVWDVASTGWLGAGDADGSRVVTFADGATVTIDVHGRELAKGDKIVGWSEAPENIATLRFKFDDATAESGEALVVTETGIYYAADETTVAHAYWTGAIDNDATNPGNWACTNFMGNAVTGEHGVPGSSSTVHFSGDVAIQIPSSQPIPYDSIEFNGVRLMADCDWSGLAEWAAAVDKGDAADLGSIDLNGHKLRLVTNATSEEGHIYDFVSLSVTDTSSGVPGELHIKVPGATTYLECSGFALSGNLKLVTEGLGWITMMKTYQSFTGGVLIAEGTGYAALGKGPENSYFWGPAGGTITVAANATFDLRGNLDFHLKNFVLDGGTLANTAGMGEGNQGRGMGNVRLTADSALVTGRSLATIFSAPNGTERIDLNGHTLVVSTEYAGYLYVNVPVVNGTLEFRRVTDGAAGGYLSLKSGMTGGSQSVSIDVLDTAMHLDGDFSVSNYVARYTGGYNRGAAAIKVYGTFTPAGVTANGVDCFHGCEMQNGSSIDLSEKTGAWSNVAGWGGGNANGNKTITFADGATVNVLLGSRKVHALEKVVDWSAAVPANYEGLKFFGVRNGGRVKMKVEEDGIYYPKTGMTLILR